MLDPDKKRFTFSDVGDYRSISITPVLPKIFGKIVAEKLNNFLERNSIVPLSQFLYLGRVGAAWEQVIGCLYSLLLTS